LRAAPIMALPALAMKAAASQAVTAVLVQTKIDRLRSSVAIQRARIALIPTASL
jgi:hypothetical protein